VAFWASLRREEGRSPKISLAYLPPEQAGEPLTFGRALPLEAGVLTRLAPAVERPGIHLGVWPDGDGLRVWGTTRHIPPSSFVLEVIEPGLLVIKRRRGPAGGKYANVAVLQGDQVMVVDEGVVDLAEGRSLGAGLLGMDSPASWMDPVNVVVQLAVSMRAHGGGGSLLIVPDGSEAWRRSIVHPIAYPVVPAFSGLAALLRRPLAERQGSAWQEEVRRAVEGVAGLTAVDGATVLSDRYELLAFGVKIGRSAEGSPVERVVVTEPVREARRTVVHPSQLGGTRHLSAAQFVHDQPEALALVASQDGRFTVFGWPAGGEAVHAQRVEILLL
jgi:hypothetical protein